jgi:hypothetical protein
MYINLFVNQYGIMRDELPHVTKCRRGLKKMVVRVAGIVFIDLSD